MTEALVNDTSMHHLKKLMNTNQVQAFREIFLEMHVYDQGQFYLTLNQAERIKLYHLLKPEEAGDMFDAIADDHEQMPDFLDEMDPKYAAEMLNNMYDDNAADILEHLDKAQVSRFLNLMPATDANQLRELLHYQTETVGAIMTTDFVKIVVDQTVESAMTVLKREADSAETIYYLYVVNADDRLVGVLSLRDLIISDKDTMIDQVMNERVLSVKAGDDQQDVAQTIRDYNFLAVPVTDFENHLIGVVTMDDIIEVIDDEAASDYSGLAGVNVEDVSEKPWTAVSKRLPWLITLLFLGMSTASLISHYEGLVSEASILAVFISLITGTAGNAGTQSLAVAVRRLAVNGNSNNSFIRLIGSEILTGFLTGMITGVTIFLVVGLWKHNFVLGFVIGLSMMCAITVANLAGSFIPMVMDKLGFDPAVASGPFITTLSDLTSVLIYFSIASFFMQYFIGH